MAALLRAPLRAKLLYELEFHDGRGPAGDARRATSSCSATRSKIEPSPANYLADIDAGFYVSSYLRSWAFEAQLRDYLRERFGNDWFTRREAGSLLRELWRRGQQPTADELLEDVTGADLELAAVEDRIRETLR